MRIENGFPSIGLLSVSEKLTPKETVADVAGLATTATEADAQTLNLNERLAQRERGIDLTPANFRLAGSTQTISSFAQKNGFNNCADCFNEHTITSTGSLSQVSSLMFRKSFSKCETSIYRNAVNLLDAAPDTLEINNCSNHFVLAETPYFLGLN